MLIPNVEEQLLLKNNVVDAAKVRQALNKIREPESDPTTSIKMVLSESEALYLDQEFLKILLDLFGVTSVGVLDSQPFAVDRIVTIHGPLASVLRCVVYIGFVMCSDANNVVRSEPFTLKLSNYKIDVLIETDDVGVDKLNREFKTYDFDCDQYEYYLDLHIATIKGDFTTLYNALITIYATHTYKTYAADSSIELLQFIPAQKGTMPDEDQDLLAKGKQRLLEYLRQRQYQA